MAGKKTEGRAYAAELGGRVGEAVRVEGWVHDTRLLGKISFVVLRDATGKCQITAIRGKASDATMKAIEGLRQEDVIEVTGKVAKSKESGVRFIFEGLAERLGFNHLEKQIALFFLALRPVIVIKSFSCNLKIQ